MHFLPLSITITITTNESWNTETQNRSKVHSIFHAGWGVAGGYPPGFLMRVPINDDTRGVGQAFWIRSCLTKLEGHRTVRRWWLGLVGLNFGPISKLGKSFWWISKSRIRVIFVSRSLAFFSVFFGRGISESRICRFFFPFGLQESNYWEFMRVPGYSLSNWASKLRK